MDDLPAAYWAESWDPRVQRKLCCHVCAIRLRVGGRASPIPPWGYVEGRKPVCEDCGVWLDVRYDPARCNRDTLPRSVKAAMTRYARADSSIMLAMRYRGGVTAQAMARYTGLSPRAVAGCIRRLSARGLIIGPRPPGAHYLSTASAVYI